jgi:hypothetical protein
MLVEIKWSNLWRHGAMIIMKPGVIYDRDDPCLFYYYGDDVVHHYEWDIRMDLYKKLFIVINHFGRLIAKHPPGHRVYEMPEGSADVLMTILKFKWRRSERIDAIINAIDPTSRWEDIASAIEREALATEAAEAR